MGWTRRSLMIFLCGIPLVAGAWVVLAELGVFNVDVWKRETPLIDPIEVVRVNDGTLTLADGRVLRPAGVRRVEGVSAEEFDHALRVIVAQGVMVTRELGDGRAMLVAEPRFYNWCGTRGYEGSLRLRWGGSFLQCPVSELLIDCAYGAVNLDEPGLTARERWRLEAVPHMCGVPDGPRRISPDLNAFRYGGLESAPFADEMIEPCWKPSPSP